MANFLSTQFIHAHHHDREVHNEEKTMFGGGCLRAAQVFLCLIKNFTLITSTKTCDEFW